jgi:hypothetical protein
VPITILSGKIGFSPALDRLSAKACQVLFFAENTIYCVVEKSFAQYIEKSIVFLGET